MALTTITDTLYLPDLTTGDGNLVATLNVITALGVDGKNFFGAPVTVTVTAGHFTLQLEPNDTANPINTVYKVKFVISNFSWIETWLVPTSGIAVGLGVVRVGTIPPVGVFLPLSQIAPSGANPGQVAQWNGAVWTPANAPAAGITDTKYTIPYTDPAFRAAGNSVNLALFTLPARSKIWGVIIKHSQSFTGAGTTSVQVGDGSSDLSAYASPWDVTQAVADTFADNLELKSVSMSSSSVVANFFTSGPNFGNGGATFLTGGSVDINVIWKSLS